MKKTFKIVLKVLLSILGLALIIVLSAALYINSNIINIEKEDKFKGP